MRTILAIVPGIKATGMAVYKESPTAILTKDRAEMEWHRRMIITSRRGTGVSAKNAIEHHVAEVTQVLGRIYPEVSELWIEGRLHENVKGSPALGTAESHRVALVGAFLGLPAALTTRPQRLTTVLVEPAEWCQWVINERGVGATFHERLEGLVGAHRGLHNNTLYAMAIGMYAGEFSKDTSTQPKSAELPERE